jgi:serpin B
MKRFTILAMAAAMTCAAASAAAPEDVQREAAFAAGLYRQVAAEPGNVNISPFSLRSVLAPLAFGARGETRDQIGQAAAFGDDPLGTIGRQTRSLAEVKGGVDLKIANALWLGKSTPVEPAFVGAVGKLPGSSVTNLDFADSQSAAKRINDWADKATRGRISGIVDPQMLNEGTALVLTNAVYLLADWEVPFDEGLTITAPFASPGGPVPTRLMSQHANYRFLDGDGWRAIDLPYKDERLSMIVVLPDPDVPLSRIEKQLDGRWLADLATTIEKAPASSAQLLLPRLQFEANYALNDALKALGMRRAFAGDAEFSGIARAPLAVSGIVQKTFLKVNEKGTEAAAVTAATVMVTGVRMEPLTFRVDRPFLFVLRDKPTGTILFIGRVERP